MKKLIIPCVYLKKGKLVKGTGFGIVLVATIIIAVFLADCIGKYGLIQSFAQGREERLIGLVLLAVLYIYGSFQPHRHFTHSLVGMCLYYFVLVYTYQPISIPFVSGYASHICLDFITTGPIYLFWPIKKGVCLKLCKSNGFTNKIVTIFATFLCVFLIYMAYKQFV